MTTTTRADCRTAGRKPHPKSRYNKARRQAIREGTWVRKMPAEEVRAHIHALRKGPARLRLEDVAERSGVPYGTIVNLLYSSAETVTGWVATRLLALTDDEPANRVFVDATGTRRRLQALACMQWGQTHIAERLGICPRATGKLADRPFVHEDTAAKVRRVYDQLSNTLGPSLRARGRAQRLGFHGPLAWEGVDIDDPNAQPIVDTTPDSEPDTFDPVTVGFAVEGRLTYDQIQGHLPDVIETVRRLATRYGDHEIVQLLRWPGVTDHRPDSRTRAQNSLHKFRQRHGIPGPEKHEAVYAYGPRSRARKGTSTAKAA